VSWRPPTRSPLPYACHLLHLAGGRRSRRRLHEREAREVASPGGFRLLAGLDGASERLQSSRARPHGHGLEVDRGGRVRAEFAQTDAVLVDRGPGATATRPGDLAALALQVPISGPRGRGSGTDPAPAIADHRLALAVLAGFED